MDTAQKDEEKDTSVVHDLLQVNPNAVPWHLPVLTS